MTRREYWVYAGMGAATVALIAWTTYCWLTQ